MKREPSPIAIYAILHRKTKTGYIGQTMDLEFRSQSHFWEAVSKRAGKNLAKRKWLHEVAKQGVTMKLLCECATREEAEEKEAEWMERARASGWILLNNTECTKVRADSVPV